MGSPFSLEDGAVLVAVERANGGELAPLEQVLWTLDSLTPPATHPDPVRVARSAELLIRIGVVEFVENQLGLSIEGRRLLRRSGLLNDPKHVAHVTHLLQEFDELDLDEHAEPSAAPTEADLRRAVHDGEEIEETPGGIGTPVLGEEVPVGSALFGGAPWTTSWIPAVLPEDSSESEESPPPPTYTGAPAHPILERLFGRGRRERS
ncbi:MAG: hypothetical protein ABSG36_08100 [Acidimicrobiales bacterium]|jgi:hypothetical protein